MDWLSRWEKQRKQQRQGYRARAAGAANIPNGPALWQWAADSLEVARRCGGPRKGSTASGVINNG